MPSVDSQQAPPVRRRSKALFSVGVAALVVLADQLTKLIALDRLQPGKAVHILGEALQFVLVFNPGAAFSFLENATWVFTLLSTVVVVVICTQLTKIVRTSWAVAVGLLLGGALGNLIDRLFRAPGFPEGHVVDFVYTPWLVPAVYNFADIALTFAVVLLVLLSVLLPREKEQG
ncbi:signal peptidase II [Canibacter zhoujuaniae]|uniref:signal peptidase II n=1 Tax=Canibacter zhoujuaniae TaxID=2708343 RepID=UPI002444D576|nr:signal peptidase II [Canibacter zhoujuaniae]